MKENNSPFENIKDEYKMLFTRQKIQLNKWLKSLRNWRNNNEQNQ